MSHSFQDVHQVFHLERELHPNLSFQSALLFKLSRFSKFLVYPFVEWSVEKLEEPKHL